MTSRKNQSCNNINDTCVGFSRPARISSVRTRRLSGGSRKTGGTRSSGRPPLRRYGTPLPTGGLFSTRSPDPIDECQVWPWAYVPIFPTFWKCLLSSRRSSTRTRRSSTRSSKKPSPKRGSVKKKIVTGRK